MVVVGECRRMEVRCVQLKGGTGRSSRQRSVQGMQSHLRHEAWNQEITPRKHFAIYTTPTHFNDDSKALNAHNFYLPSPISPLHISLQPRASISLQIPDEQGRKKKL